MGRGNVQVDQPHVNLARDLKTPVATGNRYRVVLRRGAPGRCTNRTLVLCSATPSSRPSAAATARSHRMLFLHQHHCSPRGAPEGRTLMARPDELLCGIPPSSASPQAARAQNAHR